MPVLPARGCAHDISSPTAAVNRNRLYAWPSRVDSRDGTRYRLSGHVAIRYETSLLEHDASRTSGAKPLRIRSTGFPAPFVSPRKSTVSLLAYLVSEVTDSIDASHCTVIPGCYRLRWSVSDST